jgi:hypothetical protein
MPRFGWIDALILAVSVAMAAFVASLPPRGLEEALSLGETQAQFEDGYALMAEERGAAYVRALGHPWWGSEDLTMRRVVVSEWITRSLPVVALGLAVATFRHRVSWSRRALRRVGILSTAMAGLGVMVGLANEYVLRRFDVLERGYRHNTFDTVWHDLDFDIGYALLAIWAVLALGRRWRTSANWHDRLGRVAGASWIAYLLVFHVLITFTR